MCVRRFFEDYQRDIDIDLCFQSFAEELAQLPGRYVCILLHDHGCVALRPFAAEVLELKRLFVYPAFRSRGIGRQLLESALQWARAAGYRRIHLDTIKTRMPSAVRMYKALGFVEVPAEGGIAMPDLVEMELDLALRPPVKSSTK